MSTLKLKKPEYIAPHEIEAMLKAAWERHEKHAARHGVSLSPLEKNLLSTVRYIRRPVTVPEILSCCEIARGRAEQANVAEAVFLNLKKYGFVMDIPLSTGTRLWMAITGDERIDTMNASQFLNHKIYRG